MNKKEYQDTFKDSRIGELEDMLTKVKSMSNEQLKELYQNVNEKYLGLMLKDMNFWISMYDYSNHIKYLELSSKKQAKFITNNKEFVDFIKNLKKKINYLQVISIEDSLKEFKKRSVPNGKKTNK